VEVVEEVDEVEVDEEVETIIPEVQLREELQHDDLIYCNVLEQEALSDPRILQNSIVHIYERSATTSPLCRLSSKQICEAESSELIWPK
jgi:hypothetical protein